MLLNLFRNILLPQQNLLPQQMFPGAANGGNICSHNIVSSLRVPQHYENGENEILLSTGKELYLSV